MLTRRLTHQRYPQTLWQARRPRVTLPKGTEAGCTGPGPSPGASLTNRRGGPGCITFLMPWTPSQGCSLLPFLGPNMECAFPFPISGLPERLCAHTCPQLPEASPSFQVCHWSEAANHGLFPQLYP